jgi:MYXO-CTERM domain-containing protein
MTCPSCRRTVCAVVLFLVAMVAVVPPSVALAQAPEGQTTQAPPGRTETRGDDDSGKWGLLGLVGLAGLAGLLRRDRAPPLNRADRPGRP